MSSSPDLSADRHHDDHHRDAADLARSPDADDAPLVPGTAAPAE